MQKYCFNCMNPLGKSPFCGHCGKDSRIEAPSVPYHLPCGTVLSERYVVGRVLGEGGFGITYMGMDTKLSKRVAVKEFYPLGIASRDCAVSANVIVPEDQEEFFVNGVDRFLVEARSVAKFADEDGIVGVQDTFTENNTAYIVMDYLDGENLKQYVDNHGTLSFDAVMRLLVPVMKALKDMHAKGVIHRDISPDNIMFTKKGSLKLTDFGSAKYYTSDDKQKAVILKQGFAPEEQYHLNSEQGPYTDVYALCATIYYCITGKVPVPARKRIPDDTLPHPSQLGADIRPSSEKALMRGLAVRAKDRIPDMSTLMRELTDRSEALAATITKLPEKPMEEVEPEPTGDPASPDEYKDAKRRGELQPPTKEIDKSSKQRSRLSVALVAGIPTVIVAVVIVFSIVMAGRSAEKKAEQDAAQTTVAESYVDIGQLLSGIESRPSVPASTRSSSSAAEETTAALKPLTVSQAKNHVDDLKNYFFNNIFNSDNKARYGNKIELRNIYHSVKRTDSSTSYIAFVYRNETVDYYRVLYLSSDLFYEEDDTLKFRSTQMLASDADPSITTALNNCWFLQSGINLLFSKTTIL